MRRRGTVGLLVVAGLALALALAFFVGPYASSSPDGLEKVAADTGLNTGEERHATTGSPLADYSVKGVHDARLRAGVAGVLGVSATFVVGIGLFMVLKRARRHSGPGATAPTASGP